jgi:hypothetical protein
MVRLTVTHDDLIPGSGMETGINKGWPMVLSSMKSFLETGEATTPSLISSQARSWSDPESSHSRSCGTCAPT